MIDMNRSVDSIIQECDAIAEMKQDIKDQYNINRAHERNSGDHKYSAEYKKNKSLNRDLLSGKIPKGMDSPDYHYSSMADKKEKDERYKGVRKAAQDMADHGISRKELHKNIDAAKESVSIFDDLLDLV
jgi:hypothetical protein